MIRTVAFGIAITVLFAWLDFLAGFVIYDWAGGDFGGYGAAARHAARWALPAWITFTIALIALDAYATRRVYLATRS